VTIENPHFKTVVDQDGIAILDIDRGLVSTLNPTGTYVWQRLQRGISMETTIADLALETGEEVTLVERDVLEFVECLKKRHLLRY
jgi:hypothetical protein